MDHQQAQELLTRYQENRCNTNERKLVEQVLIGFVNIEEIPDANKFEINLKQLQAELERKIRQDTLHIAHTNLKRKFIIAAAALLLIGCSLYFLTNKSHQPTTVQSEIPPGYNQAVLTLTDGTQIKLDSSKTGIQINDQKIVYNDKTSLKELVSALPSEKTMRDLPLQLTTPRGGMYQVILSDGTKVSLNAASTLKYPASFTDSTRIVEISGEAFFEIAEDKAKPFKVLSNNQEICVLGTSFNVSAYEDDKFIKTTVASGALKVTISNLSIPIKLYAGEQTIVRKQGTFKKQKVDIASELAWINGDFAFSKESLEEVLRRISRWYDVSFEYSGLRPTNKKFIGFVSRDKNLSEVLHVLALTDSLNFKIADKKVYVIQNN